VAAPRHDQLSPQAGFSVFARGVEDGLDDYRDSVGIVALYVMATGIRGIVACVFEDAVAVVDPVAVWGVGRCPLY
jgi:hypothetical protein